MGGKCTFASRIKIETWVPEILTQVTSPIKQITFFQIRIAFIWGFSILLAIPQLIAFRVHEQADGNHVVPQCLPVNIPWEYLMW